MGDYRQGVADEKATLDEKIKNLQELMKTDIYKGLRLLERRCLYRQVRVMELYSDILEERITTFNHG